jgi:hypothetical protein
MSIVKVRLLGECAIQVDDFRITPDAPRLFALSLYMAQSQGRWIHKSELLDLLFQKTKGASNASHSLRQLIYRLRGLGMQIQAQGQRLQLEKDSIRSTLVEWMELTRADRIRAHASDLRILPAYEPAITPQWTDWVEATRTKAITLVQRTLEVDIRELVLECDWGRIVEACRRLADIIDLNDDLVAIEAEALLMLGKKGEAVSLIDSHVTATHTDSLPLRALKTRILRMREPAKPYRSAFRGRSDAMRGLTYQWNNAISGAPQYAVIVGPPGIGKSRLAHEFGVAVGLHDARCMTYTCDSSDFTRPHSLFKFLLPALRSLRGSLGADPTLRTHLDRLTGDGFSHPPMEPAFVESAQSELQLALVDLVAAVTSERPALLVIDDAQHLDAASRSVLGALYHHRGGMPLMFICCHRVPDDDCFSFVSPPSVEARTQVYRLSPLNHDDSVDILRELLPSHKDNAPFLATCAQQGEGNPYYLHVIAQTHLSNHAHPPLVFDIQHFAASAYLSLGTSARTLFECCLLLGRYGTLKRVREVALLDGPALLGALRTLEGHGLISFIDGSFRCSHSLLEEACRSLIPSAIAAALHERIAECLEAECHSLGLALPTAWAAADHWLSAGDTESATRLLRKCASQAAMIGEPLAAAQTLLRVPLSHVSPADQCSVLREVIDYSQVGGDRSLVAGALRDLLSAERARAASRQEIQEVEFQIIEADLQQGANPSNAVSTLSSLLMDVDASRSLRIRAGIRLLIAADMGLDVRLAAETHERLAEMRCESLEEESLLRRAALIFETTFGNRDSARELALSLVESHPRPSLHQASVASRGNAAFALCRLGLRPLADPLLEEQCDYMSRHRVRTEAVYCRVLLADNALCYGNLSRANELLLRTAEDIGLASHLTAHLAGFLSSSANVAIAEHRFSDAEELTNRAQCCYPAIVASRYRAIELALRCRIRLGIDSVVPASDLTELRTLYERGRSLGAQDSIMEALWLAYVSQGATAEAHHLLMDYMSRRRREQAAPDWSLRSITSKDSYWLNYDVQTLRSH